MKYIYKLDECNYLIIALISAIVKLSAKYYAIILEYLHRCMQLLWILAYMYAISAYMSAISAYMCAILAYMSAIF